MYLHTAGIRYLNPSDSDKKVLEGLLKLRISTGALEKTKLNTHTNSNEGSNRGLSASMPKNVNFSRNAPARAHAAVHRLNYGHGESLLRKLQAVGSPISKGGSVATFVQSLQHSCEYNRNYKKTALVKIGHLRKKSSGIQAYYKAKNKAKSSKIKHDYYRKGQLDPKPSTSGTQSHVSKKKVFRPRRRGVASLNKRRKQDHTYAKLF